MVNTLNFEHEKSGSRPPIVLLGVLKTLCYPPLRVHPSSADDPHKNFKKGPKPDPWHHLKPRSFPILTLQGPDFLVIANRGSVESTYPELCSVNTPVNTTSETLNFESKAKYICISFKLSITFNINK